MAEDQQGLNLVDGDDVVGYVPRYAIPSISSLLPTYTNSEQDFINRAFHTGNYDYLKHLPDDIKYRQVVAARTARMEAARQFLTPALSGPLLRSGPQANTQGLFQAFEYQSTPFSLEDELASKARTEGEAKRIAIGGKEFIPSGTIGLAKHQERTVGQAFPYLGGAYEAMDDTLQAYRLLEAAKLPEKPFVPSGTDKLAEKPTRQSSWDMMNKLRDWIIQDWEGCVVSIFENHQDCWVIRVDTASVESLDGLQAYMNVFVRCNELVGKYRLVKVPEFWHTTPEDGGVYYVLRPPWVHLDGLQTFFTLHPEERHWTTSLAVQAVNAGQQNRENDEAEGRGGGMAVTVLSRDSRLVWGTNFLTGTPGTAAQAKMVR